jgi:hypothetical protein
MILVIAQNPIWLNGLASVCRQVAPVAGVTARELVASEPSRWEGEAPALAVHHCGDEAQLQLMDVAIDRWLRHKWPALGLVTITDNPRRELPGDDVRLPQNCGLETLRETVRTLLSRD